MFTGRRQGVLLFIATPSIQPIEGSLMAGINARLADVRAVDETDRSDLRTEYEERKDQFPGESRSFRKIEEKLDRDEPMLKAFTLELEERLDSYQPGQFVALEYDDTTRFYSVVDVSDDGQELELYIRKKETGELTPKLWELDEGDGTIHGDSPIQISEPQGHFTLTDDRDTDKLFVSTGTGLAPHLAMLAKLEQEEQFQTGKPVPTPFYGSLGDDVRAADGGDNPDYHIISCASWEDELGYDDRLEAMDAEYDNVHYDPVLSQEGKWDDEWDGRTGYVQEVLQQYFDEEEIVDSDDVEVYLCGNKDMLESTQNVLLGNGENLERDDPLENSIGNDQLHRESYG